MNELINNYIKSNIEWLPERVEMHREFVKITLYTMPYALFTNWAKVYILITIPDYNDIKIFALDYSNLKQGELYTYDINTNTLIASENNHMNNLTNNIYKSINEYIKNNKDFIDIVISLREDIIKIYKEYY